MAGFHHFISSWFFVDRTGRRILVDPGPAGTIPLLLDKLSSVTDGVDLVLLTHIHLDHSGGIGQLCEQYGGSAVAAHPKAMRHLVDPRRLWSSSLEVLGDVAEMFGEPAPL
jgi:glyoxylase-like metal-dependent hydrolase (beta-lactamase superfamily II)